MFVVQFRPENQEGVCLLVLSSFTVLHPSIPSRVLRSRQVDNAKAQSRPPPVPSTNCKMQVVSSGLKLEKGPAHHKSTTGFLSPGPPDGPWPGLCETLCLKCGIVAQSYTAAVTSYTYNPRMQWEHDSAHARRVELPPKWQVAGLQRSAPRASPWVHLPLSSY